MNARTFLIFSQVYLPDTTALGQHLADVAQEMTRRGYRTIVYTARNGYEDASQVFPAREVIEGVEVRRLPWSSFGKGPIRKRLVAQIVFLLQAMAHGLFVPRLAGMLVSTSPPACGIGAAVVSILRGVPLKFWVMDVNPDQLVEMKVLPPKAWPVRLFDFFNWVTLRRARDVVVLDRFMAERVARKTKVRHKMHVLPPWPLSPRVLDLPHAGNAFRARLAPEGQRVLMYSGLHTRANPLTTILDAVQALADEPRLLLACIGAGDGKAEVRARIYAGARNIVSLPYQPLSGLDESLSAADVHVVSIGNEMVGICHPCKIYGAMAVSRPVLVLGPRESHVAELVARHQCGWHVEHGDVAGATRVLREIMEASPETLHAMGRRGAAAIEQGLSKPELVRQVCDLFQQGLKAPR